MRTEGIRVGRDGGASKEVLEERAEMEYVLRVSEQGTDQGRVWGAKQY
jgi:hypothetical protein